MIPENERLNPWNSLPQNKRTLRKNLWNFGSKNKRTFLEVVDQVNQQLVPESRINTETALAWYDKEISPYGYPTHQSILLAESLSMFYFNKGIAKNQIKDKEGNLMPGEGFGHDAKSSCPNYYITDDLANSLIETKPPEEFNIDLEVLPLIKVIFSKRFDKINTIAISRRSNNQYTTEGIEVRVNYTVTTEVVKESPVIDIDFFIPFNGEGHCMFCDTKELFRERFLEKNYFKVRVASRIKLANVKNTKLGYKWEPKHETAVEIVNDFIKNHMNDHYRFVINLLCLMTQEPEIISVQSPPSKYTAANNKGFGAEKINNVPNVHWLGEHFTTRVVESKTSSSEPQGCSPKKSHWRRGHWHTILQGPGRKQRTMKWFKPTFIKGHKQVDLIKEET